MISIIAKLLHLPAYSIDEKMEAVGAMREGHYLVREDDVKGVVVQLRSAWDAHRKGCYTRAEVLAFGERVAAEYERQLSMTNTAVDVDVARLLEEDK